MTKFAEPSFNSPANSTRYVDNWERVFGKKDEDITEERAPEDQRTGFDKYFEERMLDSEFAEHYEAFKESITAHCEDTEMLDLIADLSHWLDYTVSELTHRPTEHADIHATLGRAERLLARFKGYSQ